MESKFEVKFYFCPYFYSTIPLSIKFVFGTKINFEPNFAIFLLFLFHNIVLAIYIYAICNYL